MPVLSSDIARSLDKLADLIELDGATRSGSGPTARAVSELPRSVLAMTPAGADGTS